MTRKPALALCFVLLACIAAYGSQAAPPPGPLSFYRFAANGDDSAGGGRDFITHNAAFLSDALRLNGIYGQNGTPGGYKAQTPNISELDYSNFTIAADFNADVDAAARPIFVGGTAFRWIEVKLSSMSELEVVLNNGAAVYPAPQIIRPGQWYSVAVALDLNAGRVRLSLDRQTVVDQQLPAGFRLEVVNSARAATDKIITLENYGNATAFKGMIRNLAIYPSALVLSAPLPSPAPQVTTGNRSTAPPAQTTRPSIISRVEPEYTDAAREAKFQGTVLLELIVRKDGTPDAVRVLRAAGLGLDEQAVAAIKRWRFNPATQNGEPVDFYVTIEVSFNLK